MKVEPGDRRVRVKVELCFLIVLMTLGLVIRLLPLWVGGVLIDSDEAIVGLMARHILQMGSFEELPVFYYGQHYMGSLEPLLTALAFSFLGESPFVLKLVPLVFSILLIPLTYLLALQVSGRSAARLAALLITVPSLGLVEWSSMARGGFMEIVLIGTAVSVLTVRWLTLSSPGVFLTGVIGLLLGVGWWVNNQIVFTLLPVGLSMLVGLGPSLRLILRHLLAGLGWFAVGSLPFWFYNVSRGFPSFGMFGFTDQLSDNLSGLVYSAIPTVLGARRFWEDQALFPGATPLAYGVYLFLFSVLFFRLVSPAKERLLKSGVLFSLTVVVTALVMFATSSFGSLYSAPRYLLPIYPHLYVLVAVALTQLSSSWLQPLFLMAPLTLNVWSCYLGGISLPGMPFAGRDERVSRDHSELISWLKENEISQVRTNYWVAYRLAFETGEGVIPVQFGDPRQVRIPDYESRKWLEASPEDAPCDEMQDYLPLILTPEFGSEVMRGLRLAGFSFDSLKRSGYRVIFGIRRSVSCRKALSTNGIDVITTHNPETAQNLIDGDGTTRWGSAAPQNPTMRIRLVLSKERRISGLRIELGQWVTDAARGLEVRCLDRRGQGRTLLDRDGYIHLKEYYQNRPLQIFWSPLKCKEVVLDQVGSDSFFDWSVADLVLFE